MRTSPSTAASAPGARDEAAGVPPRSVSLVGWRGTFLSLTNPHFRLLWTSMLFSFTAIQMSFIAQGYLTFQLADSATALGVVGLGWGISQLICTPLGGVAADRLDKRKLIVVSQAALCGTSLATAILNQTGLIAVWQIFVMALIGGAVFAFNVPARQAWIPELVEREQLMNAVALNTSAFTFTGILGPSLFGALIALPLVGVTAAYYVMAGCFAVTVLLLLRIPSKGPAIRGERQAPLRELLDGWSYVRRHQVLPFLLLIGFVPIVLGMPYGRFLPVFQERVYGVSDGWLGAMGAMVAVGALAGSLGVASLSGTSKRSLIQLVAAIAFGVALVLFAAAPTLPLGLVALLFVGFASNGFWALNNTLVLGNTDEEYYGRVMSVYMLNWSVVSFAALPESALIDVIGAQRVLGGVGVLLVVLVVATALLLPGQKRLREHEARALRPT